MASSGQQKPHLTMREQSESWWQFLHELGTSRSVATSETAVAVMPNFFCLILFTHCQNGILLFLLSCPEFQRHVIAKADSYPLISQAADRRSGHRTSVGILYRSAVRRRLHISSNG